RAHRLRHRRDGFRRLLGSDHLMGRDRLSAVALRLVVIAGVCVFAVYVGEWLALIVNDASKAADYTAFMTGWTIVLDGRGKDLYEVATAGEWRARAVGAC